MIDIDNTSTEVNDEALFNEVVSRETETAATTPEPDDLGNLQPVQEVAPEPVKPEPVKEEFNPLYGAMKEEREKRQSLERELADYRAQKAAMERELSAYRQPQATAPAPDIFENPGAYVQAQIQPAMDRQHQVAMYNARLIAEARFSESDVNAAQQAFDALVERQTIAPAEYHQVASSPNPFAEVVKWHKRQQTLSEVGTDPAAYKEKLLSEAMNDPAFRQKAIETWKAQASTAAPAQRAPVINLPSLRNVGSAAIQSNQDMDDGELFSSITSRKRR